MELPNWAIQAAHEIDHFYIRREQDDENEEAFLRPNLEDIAGIFLKWFPARAEAKTLSECCQLLIDIKKALDGREQSANVQLEYRMPLFLIDQQIYDRIREILNKFEIDS